MIQFRMLAVIVAAVALVPLRVAAQEKSLEEIMRGLMSTQGTRGMSGVKSEPQQAPPSGEARVAVPIEFEYNSAVIDPHSRRQLETVAQALQSDQLRSFAIDIEGHTDERGSADYNMRLSNARAGAVRNHLVGLGVSSDRLQARGYGEGRPLPGVAQETEEGRARNRRVELVNLGRAESAKGAAPAEIAPKPSVRVSVRYQKSGRAEILQPGGTLDSNDSYRVSFTSDQDAFVYLYQIDSSGKAQPLFPSPDISKAGNPARAKQAVDIPSADGWLTLDANRGEEQIVAIASKEALADPKSLAFDHWSALGSGPSRGMAAAPRPGHRTGPGEDVSFDRFHFLHR